MNRIIFILLPLIITLISGAVKAQILPDGSDGQYINETDQHEPEHQHHSPDKIVKPKIDLWYLNGNGAFLDSTKLDTLHHLFHIYHPVYKDSYTISEVGNYAGSYLDNNFFNRKSNLDFLFLRTKEAYLLTPKTVKYYNTRTPYTHLDYTQSEHRSRKNETRFNVLHTQNVNPFLNFTFRFDQARSAGQYKNQDSKNHFITLYSAYTKDHLYLHGGFISNAVFNNENGGLTADADLLGEPDTDFLNVNLTTAKNEYHSTWYYLNGEYRFGKYIRVEENLPDSIYFNEEGEEIYPVRFEPRAGVLYSFELQNNRKSYSDREENSDPFYEHSYLGDGYIVDSVRFQLLRNVVQLKHYENPDRLSGFGKRVFLGQEFALARLPGEEIGVYTEQTRKYSNVYAGGGIFRQTGTFWRWNFDGRIFFIGRNRGATEINGIITKPIPLRLDTTANIVISGSLENRVPDLFQEEYYSNRIRWSRELKMEQQFTGKGAVNFPGLDFKFGVNYALINNYLFNDSLGMPSNYNGQLLVLSGYAEKGFDWKNFNFNFKVLGQKASNDNVIHLPAFSAAVSSYYSFTISKVLYSQIGVDAYYNTPYFADAYHPATGLFYYQKDVKVGGYPYIDAYASLRLKRTKLFFKLINIGSEFIDKEYYTVPSYPMNRMTFRLGVAWAFYD